MSNTPQTNTLQEAHDYGPSAPREFYFKLDGEVYVLVEPKSDAVINYRDAIARQVKYAKAGATSDGGAKFEPVLLARALYHVNGDNRSPMTADFCRFNLPAHVFKDLFARLEKWTGLDQSGGESMDDRVSRLEEKVKELEEQGGAHAAMNGEGTSPLARQRS